MADISAIQLPDGNTYNIKDDSSGYITGMTILSYGSSTWQDFLDAYNAHKVVYCRASSNSNPASGSQTRLAFMAYVNNATTPTNVEFQYYRSVSTHTESQQGDQVYVYKLDKTAGWTVTVREASVKVVAGTGLGGTYSNGTMTLTGPTISLNGSSTTSASFYAPTSAGTSGYYLKSNGSGAPTWATIPAGVTVTLNGSTTTTPSFYAPTTAGTSGQVLTSNGSGTPTWQAAPTPLIGTTANTTPTQVKTAMENGRDLYITHTSTGLEGTIIATYFNYSDTLQLIETNAFIQVLGVYYVVTLRGSLINNTWESECVEMKTSSAQIIRWT